MGYSTDFYGKVSIEPALTPEQVEIIQKFSETRHGDNINEFSYAPSFWCDWTVSKDGKFLHWNGSEKFYSYDAWLSYLIKKFFKPWSTVLNGEIEFQGEDRSDRGFVVVINNEVTVKKGRLVYE